MRISPPAEEARGTYVKVAERAVWDFCSSLSWARRSPGRALCWVGSPRCPGARRRRSDVLAGQRLATETISRAAEAATSGAEPLADNGYKIDLIHSVGAAALRWVGEER